ncbi:MAG: diaminopimelate epimerase, partial [Salinisphaera sp.]|nr:diaminopimelate epimerase [Salinisphaera sp.]
MGNDFVLFDATQAALELSASTARAIADRRTGIGCDQILIALPPPGEDVDYGCRIYNADGTQSGQCGNGARCLARFLRARGLVHRDRMVVATDSARLAMEIAPDGTVCVNMGLPAFDPPAIPMRAPTRARAYPLTLGDGRSVSVQALSMGNPHAVVVVADVACAPVSTLGPELERHPCFPERANVGFMALRDAGHIDLRVFERGVGETSACGSG